MQGKYTAERIPTKSSKRSDLVHQHSSSSRERNKEIRIVDRSFIGEHNEYGDLYVKKEQRK